jgi:formate hydrogenlyase subunit 6/NADH:ubiquinone oxidoreductase subunit I
MCHKVCPANAIELYPVQTGEKQSKRIVIYLARCTFCGECVDACPKDAITMNKNFMLADTDRNGPIQIVGLNEKSKNELPENI